MNTDNFPDSKLLLKEETQRVIGHAFSVLNELGHGLNEKIYENSLTVAFKQDGIAFDQQRNFSVLFRGKHVGLFIPDLITFGSVIVDTKVINRITDHERGQMLKLSPNYQAPCRINSEFQTRPAGTGANCPLVSYPC